jgi:hypothetical protein
LSPEHRLQAERAIVAAYSDNAGLSTEGYVCDAVEDFLNYAIPRIAGLPDENTIFDSLYEQFDSSFFGDSCLVTMFAILTNVYDNAGRGALPPNFSFRYYVKGFGDKADQRWSRDRVVPFFEISKAAHPIGRGRGIKDESHYFIFEYSASLPKTNELTSGAYALKEDMTKKLVLALRLLKHSPVFSDYQGFRTLGHLSTYSMNVMNSPDDHIRGGFSSELDDHDAIRLRRLLPRLAGEKYGQIAVLDTKIDDALRRNRDAMLDHENVEKKVAVDQLLDYCQILETVLPGQNIEFFALYASAILKTYAKGQFGIDPHGNYEFIKRMYKVRNEVMHGRIDGVFTSNKYNFVTTDLYTFRQMIHILAALYIMNGELTQAATKIILGQDGGLKSIYPDTPEKMHDLRQPKLSFQTW